MDEITQFDGISDQFRFLLQPVRDLAKNWDIDIKHYLEDYLIKLSGEQEEQNLNGNHKLFNFAEAAVIIDGSTNIYSKKVDYLLEQARACLDLVSVAKNDKLKKRKEDNVNNGQNIEDEGYCGIESDNEDPNEQRKKKNSFLNSIKQQEENQIALQLQKLEKQLSFLPIVPLAFMPLLEYEKTNVVIYNRGEIVGKKDDFKINTCQIIDGMALLDLKNLELSDKFTQFTPNLPSIVIEKNLIEIANEKVTCTQTDCIESTNSVNLDENKENIEESCDNGDYFADFFDNNDLIDELNDISVTENAKFGRPLSQITENNCIQSQTITNNEFSMTQHGEITNLNISDSPAYNLRPNSTNIPLSNTIENNTNKLTNEIITTALTEVFEPLDPLEYRAEKSKPFVLNEKVTIMAAKQVKQRNKKIEKECRNKNVPNIDTVKNYIDTQMFRRKIRKRSYAFAQFNSFLMDQALLSLNSQFYEELKRRNAIRKKREAETKLALRIARRTSQLTSNNISIARGHSLFEPPTSPLCNNFEDPSEELAADDIIDHPAFDDIDDHINERPLGDILTVEDLGDQEFNAYNGGNFNSGKRKSALIRNENFYDDTIYMGEPIEYPDDLPPRPISQMEYNELVEYHLKKYWTIKEESLSKFAERVRKWEEKISPLLEEELTHRPFSTRDYSTDIIHQFNNKIGNEIDFSNFSNTFKKRYELSRYLLVSLILTNMQNVKIIESDLNSLKLKLVKLERHDEMFDDEQRLITGA